MLTVVHKAFSYSFDVMQGANTVALARNVSGWRDRAEIRIDADIYTARRDGNSYLFELGSRVAARADQPRKWLREFFIEHEGRRYTLRPKSRFLFRRHFLLLEGSTQVGSVAPDGAFTRKAGVELPPTLPVFLQVFITWLVMTMWKRDD
jgi:hypothetical protein